MQNKVAHKPIFEKELLLQNFTITQGISKELEFENTVKTVILLFYTLMF